MFPPHMAHHFGDTSFYQLITPAAPKLFFPFLSVPLVAGSDTGTSSSKTSAFRTQANTPLEQASSSKTSFDIVSGKGSMQESSSGSHAQDTSDAVPESAGVGMSPPGTPSPEDEDTSSVRTTESKIDEIYDRQFQVQQVAQAQVRTGTS